MSDEWMGGDMRVRLNAPGMADASGGIEPIDANSVSSGDYTEQRTLPNGSQLYFTRDGAAAYDDFRRAARGENGPPLDVIAEADPRAMLAVLLKLIGVHKGNEDRLQGRVEP